MNRILTLTKVPVTPDTLVVSLADLKLFLQLEGTANDSTLTAYIKAATSMVEEYLNLAVRANTVTVKFEQRDSSKPCPLPYAPIDTVTSAKWQECPLKFTDIEPPYEYQVIIDGETDAQFYGDMGRGQMMYPTYRLVYTTGAFTDAAILEAIKIQAGWMWTNRDSTDAPALAPQALALIQTMKRGTF